MTNSKVRSDLSRAPQTGWQLLAFAICLLFGMAMIANIQLGGEATWFWYAQLMHRGVRLYSDLHLPLQPWYAVETNAWLRLSGIRCLPFEALSMIHVLVLCAGMLLMLRESPWPDAWKAIIFLAAFITDIFFVAIRFDDFHVVNDIFYIFSILILLRLHRSTNTRVEAMWACAGGLLCGTAFTNRSTDGGTLLLSAGICVVFLPRRNRLLAAACYSLGVLVSVVCVVGLTGDSLQAYASYSIFHAAAAKGGTSTLMHGPMAGVIDNLYLIRHQKRCWWFVCILLAGFASNRMWRRRGSASLAGALTVLVAIGLIALLPTRYTLWNGTFLYAFNVAVQATIYPLCLWIFYRLIRSRFMPVQPAWSPKEILILIPLAGLLSAAVSQANGTNNSTLSLMLLFLLSTWWYPATGRFSWLTECWVVMAGVVVLAGAVYKIQTPYNWNTYSYDKMFTKREWFQHPVYGAMYMESDLLHFIQPICSEIHQSGATPELLSLPYSYANYFCATPPWHGYVQTWFDTATPQTIASLMNELNAAPPQWILYERQIKVLSAHEREYNNGKPIMHRSLDDLLMRHLADHSWSLIDFRRYSTGDGWYLIQTRK